MGFTINDYLTYPTIKTVIIKDKTLGILRYLFMAMIFAYIVVKVLIIDKEYLKHDIPIGFVRTSLMRPTEGVRLSDSEFCPQYTGKKWPFEAEQFACKIYDANNVVYPPDEVNSILLTTRIHETQEKYVCGEENTDDDPFAEDFCLEPYETIDESTYFLGGIVNYTIGIQHNFYSELKLDNNTQIGNSKGLKGKLLNHKGKVVQSFEPSKNETPDVITLGTVLEAAGVDISLASRDTEHSIYYSGMVIFMLVKYSNADNGVVSYTYTPQRIDGSDYKLFETRWDKDKIHRKVIKRAGVKIVFTIVGDFSTFDPITTLITLTAAIGLFNVANLLVEFIMLYILPYKNHYHKAKFDDVDLLDKRRLNSEIDQETGETNEYESLGALDVTTPNDTLETNLFSRNPNPKMNI